MKCTIYQVSVEAVIEDDQILIAQENPLGERDEIIAIDPLQVDLLIAYLEIARDAFFNDVSVKKTGN